MAVSEYQYPVPRVCLCGQRVTAGDAPAQGTGTTTTTRRVVRLRRLHMHRDVLLRFNNNGNIIIIIR
eukprot:3589114-Rhodomonas_salina.1